MMSLNNPLYVKADQLAKKSYELSINFPHNEVFGLTSQFRRAALSVVLNIVEGFARQSQNEFRRFLLISFGSLEECRYLVGFAFKQKYLTDKHSHELIFLIDEIAKIIWSIINKGKKEK